MPRIDHGIEQIISENRLSMQINCKTAVQPYTPTSRSFPGNCRLSHGLATLLTALPASSRPCPHRAAATSSMSQERSEEAAPRIFDLRLVTLSGMTLDMTIPMHSTVRDLEKAVAQAWGKFFLQFLTPGHQTLRSEQCLDDCGLRAGDTLQICLHRPQVAATEKAFAAWSVSRHRIVTWGDYWTAAVTEAPFLHHVQGIQVNAGAFAAILENKLVYCFGAPECGGHGPLAARYPADSGPHVQAIQATLAAFAAISIDGAVLAWGDPIYGGDASEVQKELHDIVAIQSTARAFAAIRRDGFVVTWGNAAFGGDSSAVAGRLRNVKFIQATISAFAAITDEGRVVCWGNPQDGGDCSYAEDLLQNVVSIQASDFAFAAILGSRSVVTWGCQYSGGDTRSAKMPLQNVQSIQRTEGAFAAIRGK